MFSLGISTNRDEWIYDEDRDSLAKQDKLLVGQYESETQTGDFTTTIKWSRNLKRRFDQGKREGFDARRIIEAQYRPYCKKALYDSALFIDESGLKNELFPSGSRAANVCIVATDPTGMKPWLASAVALVPDLHYVGAAAGISVWQGIAFRILTP